MRRTLRTSLFVTALALCASCLTGPQRLSRGFDGWVDARRAESPEVQGALLGDVVPLYPVLGALCSFSDFVFLNPFHFWTRTVWGKDEPEPEPEAPADDAGAARP